MVFRGTHFQISQNPSFITTGNLVFLKYNYKDIFCIKLYVKIKKNCAKKGIFQVEPRLKMRYGEQVSVFGNNYKNAFFSSVAHIFGVTLIFLIILHTLLEK